MSFADCKFLVILQTPVILAEAVFQDIFFWKSEKSKRKSILLATYIKNWVSLILM